MIDPFPSSRGRFAMDDCGIALNKRPTSGGAARFNERLDWDGRAILLDVEGTTSSIRFVTDVLFPFAARHLAAYLSEYWDDPPVRAACDQIARDAGRVSLEVWSWGLEPHIARELVAAEVRRLMAADAKTTGLKELQGLIWKQGFASGELVAHVYEDVPPALSRWAKRGIDTRIYSSGSSGAQKLFFAHTLAGNLLPFLRGHYDTTIGPKRAPTSYEAIARSMARATADILFLSDVVEELDAARAAGMGTGLVRRPGNAPTDAGVHPVVETFDAVLRE